MGLINEENIGNQDDKNSNLEFKIKQMACWQNFVINQSIYEIQEVKKHVGYMNLCFRRFLTPIPNDTKPEFVLHHSLHTCSDCRREIKDNVDGFPNRIILFKQQTNLTENDIKNWLKEKFEKGDRWALSHIEIKKEDILQRKDIDNEEDVPF